MFFSALNNYLSASDVVWRQRLEVVLNWAMLLPSFLFCLFLSNHPSLWFWVCFCSLDLLWLSLCSFVFFFFSVVGSTICYEGRLRVSLASLFSFLVFFLLSFFSSSSLFASSAFIGHLKRNSILIFLGLWSCVKIKIDPEYDGIGTPTVLPLLACWWWVFLTPEAHCGGTIS